MGKRAIGFALSVAVFSAGGCSSRQVYQSAYEGLQTRQRLTDPSYPDRPGDGEISYEQYERERKALLDGKRDRASPQE